MKRVLLTVMSAQLLLSMPLTAEAARPESVSENASAESFSYNLSRGQSQSYSANVVFRSEFLAGPIDQPAITDTRFQYTWEVQSIGDDGIATVANSITSPAGTFFASGESEDISPVLAAMRSARLSHQVGRDGTVSGRVGNIDTSSVSAEIGNSIGDVLSAMWVQFPQEPVSVGDIWLQTTELQLGGGTNGVNSVTTAEYTLAGYADVGGARHAVIDVVYSNRIDGSMDEAMLGAGQTVRVVGRGSGTGYLLFNMQTRTVSELSGAIGNVLTATENSGNRIATSFVSSFEITSFAEAEAPAPAEVDR